MTELQHSIDQLASEYGKRVCIRYKDIEKIPSKCRSLEIPTATVYKTVKDVCDNYSWLLQVVEDYDLIHRVAEDILVCKGIKDCMFVDISFISTDRSPVCKCGALIFCWRLKGSKR